MSSENHSEYVNNPKVKGITGPQQEKGSKQESGAKMTGENYSIQYTDKIEVEYVRNSKVDGLFVSTDIECSHCKKAMKPNIQIPLEEFPRLITLMKGKLAKSKKKKTIKKGPKSRL